MKAVFDTLRIAAAALVAGVLLLFAIDAGLFDPTPYRDVVIQTVERTPDGNVFIHATYTKTDAVCEYVRGQPFATFVGGREALSYEPIRSGGQTDQRFAGFQNLRWLIDLHGLEPSGLEIWTRHDCNGRRVDLMMARVEIH